ncbi:MAG TPA: IucA/IucC family C-terminal-domain containing protein, partial [Nitrolancea sp.]|nr:IucA/IucC family C-terminal-domain containing protein [Nitrolancea sp.]
PQQSIRTLANITTPEKAYLKLSLSIVNTSTSRILGPHTVENAPRITDWLQGILRDDHFLREELRLTLLGEVLGFAYDGPSIDLAQPPATYGMLSCVWRESIHPYLAADEEAVPWTALCHRDIDGQPFIMPWIIDVGIESWVRRLLEVSIPPLIHYLYGYGIALESHAQNMILVHRRGIPSRVVLKDFHDGIRFNPAFLSPSHTCPDLTPTPASFNRVNRNSYLKSNDPREVRDFVLDAFFFINITELALFLANNFGFEEARFWSLARSVITSYQRRFPGLEERFKLFDLFEPTIQVEQLTKRRLVLDNVMRVHHVRNPLALAKVEHR